MSTIQLITFDLDNTLWAVDPVIIRAEALLREHLAGAVPEFDAQHSRDSMAELRNEIIAEQPHIRHDLSALRERVLTKAIAACGYSAADSQQHATTAFKLFLDARHDVELFEHVESTLQQLHSRFTLAVLTNGNADVHRLDIGRYFAFQHSSASVRASKPAPDMFVAALQEAGVQPHQAIHVGDNLVDDIQGAAAVGMHTIWVDFSGAEETAAVAAVAESIKPTQTVRSLDHIPAAIEHINSNSG